MTKDLSLEAFIRLVQIEVEKFQEHWLKHHEDNPAVYPKKMGEQDWWEQFEVFNNLRPKNRTPQ